MGFWKWVVLLSALLPKRIIKKNSILKSCGWFNKAICSRWNVVHVLIMCFSVCVCVFCRQQRNSFYLRHQRSRRCECGESGVPWGWALHLRLQPGGTSQRPPERLALGRLRGQRQLRLPFRPGVCGRPWAREELPTWICWACTHAYESTEQWGRENGEEMNTHIDDWYIDRWT